MESVKCLFMIIGGFVLRGLLFVLVNVRRHKKKKGDTNFSGLPKNQSALRGNRTPGGSSPCSNGNDPGYHYPINARD